MFLHIDLCCGLGGWQAPFEKDPAWRSVGLDIREDLEADVIADVRQLPLQECKPDLLTMSPPCDAFTRWRLPWFDEDPSLELVQACLRAKDYLQPQWWILENVEGLSKFWRESRRNIGPFHFWGDFPPIDPEFVWKQQNKQPAERRSELAAEIPYHYARALKLAVEAWS